MMVYNIVIETLVVYHIVFETYNGIYNMVFNCYITSWHTIMYNTTGYCLLPLQTLSVAPLWCDLGCCSRTVVVLKLLRTSALIIV